MTSTFGSFDASALGARVQSAVDGSAFGDGAAAPVPVAVWIGGIGAVSAYTIATDTETNHSSGVTFSKCSAFAELDGTLYLAGTAASGHCIKKFVNGNATEWQNTVSSGTIPDGICYRMVEHAGTLVATGCFTTAGASVLQFDGANWTDVSGDVDVAVTLASDGSTCVISGDSSGGAGTRGGTWTLSGGSLSDANVGNSTTTAPGWFTFGEGLPADGSAVFAGGTHYMYGPTRTEDAFGDPNFAGVAANKGVASISPVFATQALDLQWLGPLSTFGTALVAGGVPPRTVSGSYSDIGVMTLNSGSNTGNAGAGSHLYSVFSSNVAVKLNGAGSNVGRGRWTGATWEGFGSSTNGGTTVYAATAVYDP